jgi:signal transduction histidine kinase
MARDPRGHGVVRRRPPWGSSVRRAADLRVIRKEDDDRRAARYGAPVQRLRRIIAWLRALDPWRFDAALGAFVAVEGQVELLLIDGPGGEELRVRFLLVVLGLGIALRRRWTLPAVALMVAAYVSIMASDRTISDNLLIPFFSLFIAGYTVGSRTRGWATAVGAAVIVAGMLAGLSIDAYDDNAGNYLFSLLVLVVGPLVIGRVVSDRVALARTLRERASGLERQREEMAQAAVLAERARIAGELHDVIAHALGAMVVQGGAARRLAQRDPARAREAFGAIEATGRDALTEMRALLGVLRREDEELALDPQPSLAHVSTLVRRSAAAGLPVDLTVEGERGQVPAGVDLVAYRVVQQALGGALDAGRAGRAQVRVRYGTDAVEVKITDDGPGTRALPGLRERVRLYGGELHAGARRDGGHAVRARLPVVAG